MGASGNMIMAALYELLPDKLAFKTKMKSLPLPGVSIKYSEVVKCGIFGTYISVKVDGVEEISDDIKSGRTEKQTQTVEHKQDNDDTDHHIHTHDHTHHSSDERRGCKEILALIQKLDLPEKVKEDAAGVYTILGEAEAKVHGSSVDGIHFHEVGSIDAIVDVVGCCLLMYMLKVTDVIVSPVHVGFGMIRCAHGILPVPAPATAEILRGIPYYSGLIEGELCTPTGAALLKHFASGFGAKPPMVVSKTGYGMGSKDFEAANCIRVFQYTDADESDNRDLVCEISCNLDDMTPEAIGATFEILLENGALDVFTTPIMMKKTRPAVMLSCLCTKDACDTLTKLMIKHTTTLGVRISESKRIVLERASDVVKTDYGDIRVKRAEGFGITKIKPEYDDVLEALKEHGVSFQTVQEAAEEAARRGF